MKEAIQKAIEGGWKPKPNTQRVLDEAQMFPELGLDELGGTLLDPLFWQALGKSLSHGQECGFTTCPAVGEHKKCWVKVWHRFIDHLAEGKDAESFFTNLLKS